jgi:hypothetical protein
MSQSVASHPLRDRLLGPTRPGPEEAEARRATEAQRLAERQERRRAEAANGTEITEAARIAPPSSAPGYDAGGRVRQPRGGRLSLSA